MEKSESMSIRARLTRNPVGLELQECELRAKVFVWEYQSSQGKRRNKHPGYEIVSHSSRIQVGVTEWL